MAEKYGSVSDYTGRTVDVLAFSGAKLSGDTLLAQELVSDTNSGLLITGIEKLVNRFLIELLTEKGSLDYALDRGTFFMTQLRLGLVRTTSDLFTQFSVAEIDLRGQLQGEELDTDPDDERYASASVLSSSLLGDTMTLSLNIVSRAGTSRNVIFPITFSNI
tara:strand:+ start:152 stop:637 length:486 start_codon:yes stop_codon:yes gene_type:complete